MKLYKVQAYVLDLHNDFRDAEDLERYIKYLANLRLDAIGLKPLYPDIKENPMAWIESFSNLNSTKTDFFEAKVTNYTKAAAFDFDDLE